MLAADATSIYRMHKCDCETIYLAGEQMRKIVLCALLSDFISDATTARSVTRLRLLESTQD